MRKTITIGLLGMGTVGTSVVKILTENANDISQKVGIPVNIKKIMVRQLDKNRNIDVDAEFTTTIDDIINDPDIDIIVEVMGGMNPTKDYIVQALVAGKHVVTANKDVVAKHGQEIFEAADKSKVDFLFEASVAGGIPIIRPLKQCLAANKISEVMGIINGTTNYMLTKMANEGLDFNSVLAEAQAKGYAEADPTADVGGFDAARKIAILASIAFGSRVSIDDVYVEGITTISTEDITYAKELGYVIKLLAIAKDDERGIDVRVHPAFIPAKHPLASVHDVFNAIYIKGDAVGETMFYGRGAGGMPTASAVVSDIIDVARNITHNANSRILCTCFSQKSFCPVQNTESPYYIRLLVADKPGVLAAIAGAFGAQQVSLHSVIQKRKVNNSSELVLITYQVSDANLRLAINTISGMSVVNKISSVIRVEAEDFA
ncbi:MULTISPECIES: homoserine dehydrogenase [Pelosinus]|uniref:Homoserine dehydrogenase n=1 Tax=Pelosinus fermentans B4 TaxID=1149862 RepID=I9LDI0_9FIRM|nr:MULTISPECIES: homoserine dehydrogenase [Pelosinus]EIW18499.1 homoserine dehydrogenase [Pelosinus fermentans B4]EIW24513.1 homoserine dehydrogenase [Pelosinus fermentans A11]OAM94429.1 homoserine dehydrogenase [Pelosinus fermentans DSM 17108]SDR08879.1 homoserine dehydrogenase [Pelosinus fermentans]